MEKKFNSRDIATVKRIYQNVDADYQKVLKLSAKVAELTKEMEELTENINLQEAPVVAKFGYKSTDLVEKVIVPLFNEDGTPKTDKDGRQLKQTKYVLKYGEDFLPTSETAPKMETTPSAGSDFDLDSNIA